MRMNWVIQLSVVLVSLGSGLQTLGPEEASTEGAGHVPIVQLKVLTVGLVHLLQGVKESTGWLEMKGDQLDEELEATIHAQKSLHDQGTQTGKTHKKVKRDLQLLSARGDRLEREAQKLQQSLGTLVAEHGGLELQMSHVVKRVQRKIQPVSEKETRLLWKVILDRQAARLADLTSEVMARDKMIDKYQKHIELLEQQVSRIRGRKPPSRAQVRP